MDITVREINSNLPNTLKNVNEVIDNTKEISDNLLWLIKSARTMLEFPVQTVTKLASFTNNHNEEINLREEVKQLKEEIRQLKEEIKKFKGNDDKDNLWVRTCYQ